MQSSCRFAVAVHVLAVLAYQEGTPLTSRFLACSVNTNPVVIRRLLLALQEAGLVETRKGAGMGSRLARPARQITMAEVYRAVEDTDAFSLPRNAPNQDCPVGHCIQLALEKVFASAQSALERELACTTLADVVKAVKSECAREKAAQK
jgi:Rrf2 family protein